MTRLRRFPAASAFVRDQVPRAEFARRSLVALALGAAALFALLAQLGDNGIMAYWRLRAEVGRLDREVVQLKHQNEQKQGELEALANDPETLERLAREQGYRRAGEEVLTVLPRRAEGAEEARRVP